MMDQYGGASYEAESVARQEVGPNETVLWAGKPDPKRMALRSWPLTCFAIPWTAFAIFWVVAASGMIFGGSSPSNAPGIFALFPLFGLPFVLIGFGMLLAPLWANLRAKKTVYAATERRLLIITEGRTRNVQSFDASDIKDVERRERPDGSGDIVFARRTSYSRDSDGHGRQSTTEIGFFGVPNVRDVERWVRQVADR
jgi:hypothetical protein